jgi:hypothetical protein
LGVVGKRADKAYQFTLPTLPTDVAEIGVVVNNSNGEEPGSWPIVSMYDNRLSDPLTSVSTTSNLPVPSNFQGQLYYPQAGEIAGWLRWEVSSDRNILLQLAGQTIYFADTYGTKLQLIGSALEPRIIDNHMNYNGLNINEPIIIPNGATQIAIYSVLKVAKRMIYRPIIRFLLRFTLQIGTSIIGVYVDILHGIRTTMSRTLRRIMHILQGIM